MAVSVYIANATTIGDVASWSLAETGTPARVADTSGGASQLSVRAVATEDSLMSSGRLITLSSSSRGNWTGTVISPNVTGLSLDLTARDMIDKLDVNRVARPIFNQSYTRTLADAIFYYCYELCKLEGDAVAVDPSMYNYYVTIPGWEGNVWVRLKEMCAVYGYEISVQLGVLTFRRSRQKMLPVFTDYQTPSITIDASSYANNIEIVSRRNTAAINSQFYPPKSMKRADIPVLTVGANEVVSQIVTLDGSMSSIKQPVAKDTVPANYGGNDSHYTVMGNDNLPVKAKFWTDFGGRVDVRLTDMPNEIEIIVTGPNNAAYAPYSLGVSDGQNRYNTLSIAGDGVLTTQETVRYPTGVPEGLTETEVGITIDSPFIGNLHQEYTAAMGAAALYGNPKGSLSTTQYTQAITGTDIGNVTGNRFAYRNNIYRVDSATTTNASVATVASFDATDDDFKALWANRTDLDFSNIYGFWSSRDMIVEPLRKPIPIF